MSNIHVLGTDSSNVEPGTFCTGSGLYEATVPERAASMENGKPLETPKEGGSTRVNGEDEQRRREESMPNRLDLGERPAAGGAEEGAAGLRVAERAVSRRFGVIIGLDTDANEELSLFKIKWDALPVLIGYPSRFFAFLDGDFKIDGSMFSESTSSNDGECRRLTGDESVTGRAG